MRLSVLLTTVILAACAGTVHAQSDSLRIGIIGTGNIGGALARHWVNAGHEVLMSSRHPEELEALAAELGPRARAGTPREAAEFGDVVLISVPYGAMPQISRDFAGLLAGKIVLDTGNPVARRDGDIVAARIEQHHITGQHRTLGQG